MGFPLFRLGYPVSKIRLFWSVIASVFFSFLLYSASVNLGWLTLVRGFYLVLGAVEGVLQGQLEAAIVTRELTKRAEVVAWQILPINVVLGGLPLFLAINAFGPSEFLPFAAYFAFPFISAFLVTSGWRYNEFEKQHKVQIFMFLYGVKYWIEPILDVDARFAQFIDSVVSKDVFGIFYQAGYSKKLMVIMEEKHEIEPSTRSFLFKILGTMEEYHRESLACAWTFVISCFLLLAYFFILASTNAFGLIEVVDRRIVSGQAFALILGCVPTFSVFGGAILTILLLNRKYQKRISNLLTSLDLDILSKLKNLNEP